MQPKLIIAFDRLSEADFSTKAGLIAAALAGNVHFPEPWPAQVPSLAQLNEALSHYREAYVAAQTHDTLKIAERNAARDAVILMLKQLAPYLEMMAGGDAAVLATTGYDLRRDPTHNGSGPLPAPEDFRLSHGAYSGTIDVHVARLSGAKSYEVQLTEGDPAVEAGWRHVLSSATASRIVVEKLTPTKPYWFRVRGIDGNGNGLWTDPARIIVV